MWGTHCAELLASIASKGTPVVLCSSDSEIYPSVSVDQKKIGTLAVKFLAERNHREIAHIQLSIVANYGRDWSLVAEGYHDACHSHRMPSSAERIIRIPSDALPEVDAAWQALSPLQSEVTAIICPTPRIANHIIALAHRDGIKVPSDLSVITLLDHVTAVAADLPLTAIADESAMVAKLATFLLHDLARAGFTRDGRKCYRIVLEPSICERASTTVLARDRSSHRACAAAPRQVIRPWPQADIWASDLRARIEQARMLNERPFAEKRATLEDYIPVKLERFTNRSVSHERCWLGDEPLRYLPKGIRHFHGVPFHFIEENKNNGTAAIVLRSKRAHSTGGVPLATRVTIPLRRLASAIYIVHGAGWTYHRRPFAEYEFTYSNGASVTTSVVAYSNGSSDPEDEKLWREKCIIQDWHPNQERFSARHVLPCLITDDDGDPLRYERYLYAWQWINPHPDLSLRSIRVSTLDQNSRCTLGVLAITVQKPPRR